MQAWWAQFGHIARYPRFISSTVRKRIVTKRTETLLVCNLDGLHLLYLSCFLALGLFFPDLPYFPFCSSSSWFLTELSVRFAVFLRFLPFAVGFLGPALGRGGMTFGGNVRLLCPLDGLCRVVVLSIRCRKWHNRIVMYPMLWAS